ncbi:MAG: hypothetical protein ACYC99_08180 [Candidatus Geothermincolia bacterium]
MRLVWKFKHSKLNKDESGYILLMSLFVLVVLFLIGTTLAVMGIQEFTLSARTKLMDQAYAIADAGVNRAAVALQLNPTWTQAGCNDTYGPYTENFGSGTYSYTIVQSDTVPTNKTYKIVRSTGSITRGGSTAERTIETRIVAGSGGDDYDASFDYCIYNGNKDYWGQNPPVAPPAWPDTRMFNSAAIAGNYTYDGFTPYEGRSPRGALYVKGSIELPVFLWGDLTYKGNIVATDDITLKSTWAANWNDPGIKIDNNGKVIAGLDGSGTANIEIGESTSVMKPVIQINGQVIAATDVNLNVTLNAALSDAVLTINGIKAGNDVSVDGAWNILSKGLSLGSIVSGGKTSINSSWGNGITCGSIWAGAKNGGDGVYLNTKYASKITATGAIISRGRVYANATAAWVKLGSVTAGNDQGGDYGGTGIYFNMGFAECNAGNLVSQGLVNLDASGIATITVGSIWAGTDSATGSGGTGTWFHGSWLSGISTNAITARGDVVSNGSAGSSFNSNGGDIWSGGNVNLNSGELWIADDSIRTGSISAEGYVKVTSGDDIVVGQVKSESWIGIRSADLVSTWSLYANSTGGGLDEYAIFVASSNSFGSLDMGNQVQVWGTIQCQGPILYHCTANWFDADSNVSSGMWGTRVREERDDIADATDTELYIGNIPDSNDAIRATQTSGESVYIDGAGDLWWGKDVFLNDVRMRTGASMTKTKNWQDWCDVEGGNRVNDDLFGLPSLISVDTPSLPGKPNPVYVDRNGIFDYPASQLQNVDVLAEAGLSSTVDLLKPNWTYFEQAAVADDAVNPAAPHMIYDGGAGDSDGDMDGNIEFVWDASKPYSSRETIYNGDPSVRLEIKALNWIGKGAKFEGTVVSQGDCTITAPATDWFMSTENILNLVSGNDITSTTAGLTLWESPTCHYHFWADHNIDMTNMRFSLGGNQTYYGSFTAGNRVTLTDNSFWPNCTFQWSRWALDPVAWAPPFKVLTWKEI